jgi:hypothetical protein
MDTTGNKGDTANAVAVCVRCGHKLKDPKSVKLGLGAVCRAKMLPGQVPDEKKTGGGLEAQSDET